MATFEKRKGGWRVAIAIKGVRESKVFSTKAEAQAWAGIREVEIRKSITSGIVHGRTLQDAFDRYEKEVSVSKQGCDTEIIRMGRIARFAINGEIWGETPLAKFTPDKIGTWRDHRMNVDKVKGSTVNRDIKLLSHVFNTACKEWRWIAENPITNVRRPKDPNARERLYTQDEIDRICLALGFNEAKCTTKTACVAVAFLFAIETAMRAGEICRLVKGDIVGRVASLKKTKNGDERDVPLSKRAMELLTFLPDNAETLFYVSVASLDPLFRRARNRCGIFDATFHDSRHLAITRLAQKLDVLDLARMVGHRNINQLRIYYNAKAEDIAARLD